jgi:hypothetical protein
VSTNIWRLDPIVVCKTSPAHNPSHRLVVEIMLPSVGELTTEHASAGLTQLTFAAAATLSHQPVVEMRMLS